MIRAVPVSEDDNVSVVDNISYGNVFIVSAVYKSLGSCLRKTSIGNHKLSFGSVRAKCLKGDIVKISL